MIALPFLSIVLSGWTVLLLLQRVVEEFTWALHPDAAHTARLSDRALFLITNTTVALIAISLWSLK